MFQILFCFVYNTVNFVSLFRILLLFTRRSTLQVCFRFCFVHKTVNFASDFVLFTRRSPLQACFIQILLCFVYKAFSFVTLSQILFRLQDGQLCKFVSDVAFVLYTRHPPLHVCFRFCFAIVYKTLNVFRFCFVLFCSQNLPTTKCQESTAKNIISVDNGSIISP